MDIQRVVQFVANYADEFSIPQPAAPRSRDNTAPVYLSSDTTKAKLHQTYVDSCAESDPPHRVVKYSTFNNIWRHSLPHIKIATPRDDVCATCEKLRKKVQDSVTEEEKLQSANNLREHVLTAQNEETCIMPVSNAQKSLMATRRLIFMSTAHLTSAKMCAFHITPDRCDWLISLP